MYSQVHSAVLFGLDVIPVRIETDITGGLPQYVMVGSLSSQVREAPDRIRTAFRNGGINFEPCRTTINFSPADLPKTGNRFDLPIALSILASHSYIPSDCLKNTMAVGEIALDGRINPVTGVLPIAIKAAECGIEQLLVPLPNLGETGFVKNCRIIGIETLRDAVDYLRFGVLPEHSKKHFPLIDIHQSGRKKLSGPLSLDPADDLIQARSGQSASSGQDLDLSDIHGQQAAVRAATIAAAGFHNLLLVGPPGSGKSMLARRIPTILPSLTDDERLDIARIYSSAGLLSAGSPMISARPFRSPHHTISPQALAGGGKIPSPGEITLSHRGVLFLDEFPEFRRNALEILRQPLEDREITISRTSGTFRFPANFLLLAAMNPCPCGYFPDMKRCTCSPQQISNYINRISKPLLDRIDLCVDCPAVTYEELTSSQNAAPSSAEIRSKVEEVHAIQAERFKGTGIHFNSEIPTSKTRELCRLDNEADRILELAFKKMEMSARSYHRVMKTARTIADLDRSETVRAEHIQEALIYRVIDSKYWQQ